MSGCLSTGCNTFYSMGNSYQLGHEDEITALSFSHSIAHDSRSIHAPIQIVKKIDRSSPVLAQACSDGEELKCRLTKGTVRVQRVYPLLKCDEH
ncbi:type VI secretion system tube protein Hcp [Vibrio harveyi]|nr:type VI secretion system tube protein Hcp [Vibrio harveyi]